MPNKPKTNYNAATMPERDKCQTPSYSLEPLLPYLCVGSNPLIWEPARGEGLLVKALESKLESVPVYGTDILTGADFFENDLQLPADNYFSSQPYTPIICTNPPFSLKYKWLARCYALGYPFALLMPSDTLFAASANKLFQQHGVEIIVMNPRVDFKMPNLGWSGNGAQMSTSWFTWGLNIGTMITFADISAAKKAWKENMRVSNL